MPNVSICFYVSWNSMLNASKSLINSEQLGEVSQGQGGKPMEEPLKLELELELKLEATNTIQNEADKPTNQQTEAQAQGNRQQSNNKGNIEPRWRRRISVSLNSALSQGDGVMGTNFSHSGRASVLQSLLWPWYSVRFCRVSSNPTSPYTPLAPCHVSMSLEPAASAAQRQSHPMDNLRCLVFEAGGRTRILSLGIGHDPESGVLQLTDKTIPWVLQKENKLKALGKSF